MAVSEQFWCEIDKLRMTILPETEGYELGVIATTDDDDSKRYTILVTSVILTLTVFEQICDYHWHYCS